MLQHDEFLLLPCAFHPGSPCARDRIGLEQLVCLHRILGACPALWLYFKPMSQWDGFCMFLSDFDKLGLGGTNGPRSFPNQKAPVHRMDWNPLIPRNALVVCRANCTVAAKGAPSKRFTASNIRLLQHMDTNLNYKAGSILILGGWCSDI